MPSCKNGLTIPQMAALLDNPHFCADARAVNEKARRLNERAPTQREWARAWPVFCKRVVAPFVRKWGAFPPTPGLIKPDPQRKVVFALLTGGWGLIPVFPWTSQKEIQQRASKIRKAVGKLHKDSVNRRRALIAQWLRMHENPKPPTRPTRSEIAGVVWGRRTGLQRPSREQAIETFPESRETELLRRYTAQGLSYTAVEERIHRAARGSEARATAAVRMAETRLAREEQEFQKALQSPHRYDDCGYFLTLLLREVFAPSPVLRAIKLKASLLRDHLMSTSP